MESLKIGTQLLNVLRFEVFFYKISARSPGILASIIFSELRIIYAPYSYNRCIFSTIYTIHVFSSFNAFVGGGETMQEYLKMSKKILTQNVAHL